MRKSFEIQSELEAALAELKSAEGEARQAAADKVRKLTAELQEAQIDEAAQRAIANGRILNHQEKKELKRFSISKFIREAASGKLTGIEADMHTEAEKEMRNSGRSLQGFGLPSFLLRDLTFNNSSETGYGEEFNAVMGWNYVEALRNALVSSRLGVQFLSGLQGQVSFVKGAGFTASWYSEEALAEVEKEAFTVGTMTPKRLQILGGYTYDLLRQSALDVDKIILDELTKAHAHALDAAIFNGSGSSGQPTGIRNTTGVNTVAIGTNGGAMTFANLVKMETEVGTDNGLFGSLAYVTNAKVNGAMKTTAKIAGYPSFLIEDGKANGYDVIVSNAIPSNLTKGTGTGLSSMVFGNFNEVIAGQWGGLDFIVDPYSSKGKAAVEISALAYHDIFVKHPEAFCVCDDIVA